MARSVNTRPHLDIEHVNRWNAQIGPDRRKKTKPVKKQEPLDPEDDFIADTDPADKPIDEATIDDVMEAKKTESWTDGVSAHMMDMYENGEITFDTVLALMDEGYIDETMYYGRQIKHWKDEFKLQELNNLGTRDIMMEIGMKCDCDFSIDKQTKTVLFDDLQLNQVIIDTYQRAYENYVNYGRETVFDRNTFVGLVVETYLNATSKDTRYECLLTECMWEYGIDRQLNNQGDPVGEYRAFLRCFNKVYKNAYRHHTETEYGEGWYAWTFSEILSDELGPEWEYHLQQKDLKDTKAKIKRRATKIYNQAYADADYPEVFPKDMKSSEKFRIKDMWYREDHGYSEYDYYADLL